MYLWKLFMTQWTNMAVLNNGVSLFYNVNKLCKHLTPAFTLPNLLNGNGKQIWTNSAASVPAKVLPKESLYRRMKDKVYYHAFEKYVRLFL